MNTIPSNYFARAYRGEISYEAAFEGVQEWLDTQREIQRDDQVIAKAHVNDEQLSARPSQRR